MMFMYVCVPDGSARSAEAHSVGRESQMRPQRLPLEGTSVMANILVKRVLALEHFLEKSVVN